jgi:N-acetyl-alpha-D-muramate 1-phosphate uridylyltransferase
MKAIVLAAGRGERMRPITDNLPKPLVPVVGKPLIAYHLESLARAGIHDVVINLSYLGSMIPEALGDGGRYGVRIAYSNEGTVALETGGGIFNALPLLGPEPFLVVNGDIWTDFDFSGLALSSSAHAHLVLVPNPPYLPGDFGMEDDYIIEAEQKPFTYSGIGVFSSEFFAGCKPGKFPLRPLLARAIAARRLRGQVYRGDWSDIGAPERLAALEGRLRAGRVA